MFSILFNKTLYGKLLKTAWDFTPQKRWRFALVYVLFTLANIIALYEPILFGKIVNTIQIGGEDMLKTLFWQLLGILAIEFIFWSFHGPARVLEREIAFDVSNNYYKRLFKGLTYLPLKWHSAHHSGNLISRAKKSSESLHEFTGGQFMYIESFIKFVAIAIIFFWYVPKYAGIVILASFLLFLVTYRLDKIYSKSLKAVNQKVHTVDATFMDFISNAITIITLRVQRMAKNTFAVRLNNIWQPYRKLIRVNEWKWFMVSMGVVCIYIIVLYPYAKQVYFTENTVLLGGFVTLMNYARRYTSVFYSFADKYERLVRNVANIDSTKEIWEAISANKAQTSSLERKPWQEITIKDLHFKHDETEDAHDLKNVNINFKKGEKIALIGESGSGKSTLLRVLRGLFVPQKISVGFDGLYSKEAYVWLQNHTTLIPQDPEIFEHTIKFNITMGMPVSEEDLETVVKISRFDKVLQRLPNKYETDIREKGVNLSGGEKQRLALARGLLAALQSDVVLLDEPTSSVDIPNETQIFQELFHHWPEKTFIVSVHRKYLLEMFDVVYEMENGEILNKKSIQK